jgi:DNA polymerase-1
MRLVCDTETNGLLDQLDTIHSLLIEDVDTGKKWSLSHHPEYVSPNGADTSLSIEDGLRMIMQADLSIWHNGIGFDLLAISKVYPWFSVDPSKVFDTLVMSMLIWTNLLDRDEQFINSGKMKMPPKFKGRHSLAAWGYRLGWNKIEFDGGDWQTWTPEMQIYGEGDIPVTKKLFLLIESKQTDPRAIELEHLAKFVCVRQEEYGFAFDTPAAHKLVAKLMIRRADLEQQLKDTFGTWEVQDEDFIPKRNNKTMGYIAGVAVKRSHTVIFNPSSNQHIENRLKHLYGWKPKEFTDNGQAKIDETVLASLPYPEAKLLAQYKLVQMRLGQSAEGKQAWLKVTQKDGRIHGRILPGGAVTGRATHKEPNMSAVPTVKVEYGAECRALFIATPGRVIVGADVSGLELRMLAHFMARFDEGLYAKLVVEGDVHWVNVQALGLVDPSVSRDGSLVIHKIMREGTKTFIYAFLYGAGGEKIGSIVLDMALLEMKDGLGTTVTDKYFGGKRSVSEATLKKVGNALKKQFLARTPALAKLTKAVVETATRRGTLKGLDGRILHVRAAFAALSVLLQSAGALVCKRWMVEVDLEIERRGWRNLCQQVAWSHDELQFDCDPSISAELESMLVECIVKAGRYFNLVVPLTGEAKTGLNWADTH